ncbi:MAG: hypothetical protein AAGJ38_01315 [Planctomycetota bacterium]
MDETTSPPSPAAIDPALLEPGQRVRVIKQMQLKGWTTETVGKVQAYEQRKTGSWYAHGKDDKLWLDRLVLELDDGEIVTLNLDGYSRVERADQGTDEASTESAS